MIVGYARVSTADQNTAAQLPALKAAKCKRIYQEEGSGRTMDRPELEKCLDNLEPGDTLVVWRLDRLARSLRDLLELVARFEKEEVNFRSLSENFDTTTASGRLVFHFFAALTQFERELIRERTMLGLSAAKARGRTGGRKHKMSHLQMRQIKTLWLTRKETKVELAKSFGVSISTIDRIVRPKSLKAKNTTDS
jgi:DNA invertase Pin-like site-specific DNA recombinase